jgi:hypothetical protein
MYAYTYIYTHAYTHTYIVIHGGYAQGAHLNVVVDCESKSRTKTWSLSISQQSAEGTESISKYDADTSREDADTLRGDAIMTHARV